MAFAKSSMWRNPFKKDAPRKDVVMEDITGFGSILLRSQIGQKYDPSTSFAVCDNLKMHTSVLCNSALF